MTLAVFVHTKELLQFHNQLIKLKTASMLSFQSTIQNVKLNYSAFNTWHNLRSWCTAVDFVSIVWKFIHELNDYVLFVVCSMHDTFYYNAGEIFVKCLLLLWPTEAQYYQCIDVATEYISDGYNDSFQLTLHAPSLCCAIWLSINLSIMLGSHSTFNGFHMSQNTMLIVSFCSLQCELSNPFVICWVIIEAKFIWWRVFKTLSCMHLTPFWPHVLCCYLRNIAFLSFKICISVLNPS